MEKWQLVLLLMAGVVLLGGAVLLRARFGEKYELKSMDLVLIVLPLILVLLISGKLKVLDAFGVKLDFAELFADVAGSKIEQQVVEPASPGVEEAVRMLEMASKGGVQQIPELVAKKTEALVFRLGHGGYYGPAIKQYFDALYASSYLQYLIVLDEKDKLFGIYDALDLAVIFRTEGEGAYRGFASWLNRPTDSARKQLSTLPGFVALKQAVPVSMTKREALRRMDKLRADRLPVVDKDDRFVGLVERSRLTASLILEVSDRLEGKGKKE